MKDKSSIEKVSIGEEFGGISGGDGGVLAMDSRGSIQSGWPPSGPEVICPPGKPGIGWPFP